MKRRSANTINNIYPVAALTAIVIIWELVSVLGIVPDYLLPSPVQMIQALVKDFVPLMGHTRVTLIEAVLGLIIGVSVGFGAAVLMDAWEPAYKAFYPIIVITQTIPTVAIAPLLVLWFGYEMTPKIVLVIITTFFPIAVGVLDGFRACDTDAINLLRAMGASPLQIFRHIKIPGALPQFFSGLKISVTYAIVGAVLAEWMGGFNGLGVYMTRVKKSFAYDKMFAVILLISLVSLMLIWIVGYAQKKLMPWEELKKK
ncbi:MAG: ABC transporter permease [Mogibacterium sp.]|nr:ABC transporter permease [Mogibacterium sp.]